VGLTELHILRTGERSSFLCGQFSQGRGPEGKPARCRLVPSLELLAAARSARTYGQLLAAGKSREDSLPQRVRQQLELVRVSTATGHCQREEHG
jgi:hypothetical protein